MVAPRSRRSPLEVSLCSTSRSSFTHSEPLPAVAAPACRPRGSRLTPFAARSFRGARFARASRLACRCSLRSLLPLDHTEASLLSASRLAAHSVRRSLVPRRSLRSRLAARVSSFTSLAARGSLRSPLAHSEASLRSASHRPGRNVHGRSARSHGRAHRRRAGGHRRPLRGTPPTRAVGGSLGTRLPPWGGAARRRRRGRCGPFGVRPRGRAGRGGGAARGRPSGLPHPPG